MLTETNSGFDKVDGGLGFIRISLLLRYFME